MEPYQAVPGHVKERLEIAILCREQMDLHWEDEASGMHHFQRIQPLELLRAPQGEYLEFLLLAEGEKVRARLDLIRNLPTPVK